jgi:hypothetical protein
MLHFLHTEHVAAVKWQNVHNRPHFHRICELHVQR